MRQHAKQTFIGDLVAAFMLLSQLPCNWYKFDSKQPPRIDQSGWAFPVVGLVIGGVSGSIICLLQNLEVSNFISATIALIAMTILTGALHEDGLADMADGFGGGHSTDAKIRIMHDSCIGSYGVMALCLSSMLRVGLLANLATQQFSQTTFIIIIALLMAGSRWQILLLLWLFPVSKKAKLAKLTKPPSIAQLGVSMILWLAPFMVVLPPLTAATLGITALSSAAIIGRIAMHQISGLTGDVMGASVICAEIALMLVMVVGIAFAPFLFAPIL